MTVYNAGKAAAESWKSDYADMLLSFDRSLVSSAMMAFIRVEMGEDTVGADEETLYALLSVCFVKLLKRGALQPITTMSANGARQLEELTANFNIVPGDLRPKEPELSLVEQVAQDFNQNKVPMSEIRRRRRDPLYEAAYVEALEKALIQ